MVSLQAGIQGQFLSAYKKERDRQIVTRVERLCCFRFGFWSMPLASQLANTLSVLRPFCSFSLRGWVLGHARRTEADPWPILEIDSLRCPSSLLAAYPFLDPAFLRPMNLPNTSCPANWSLSCCTSFVWAHLERNRSD